MKRLYTLSTFLLTTLAATHLARSDSGTWDVNDSGNWGDPAKWFGGIVADGTDSTASFTFNITPDRTVTLESPRSIGNITFTDSTTSSHNLTISGANILTLDVTSGSPVIDVTQVNRRLTIGSQIAGSNGLVKSGLGILHLTNNNTSYSGTTQITAGMLDFGGISSANIGGGSGRNIQMAAGTSVKFNALTNTLLNRLEETSNEITVMTGTMANNLDFSSSGANLPNAFLGNWASNGAKAEYNGLLTPASDNYRLGSPTTSGLLGIRSVLSGSQGLIVGGGRVELVNAGNTFSGETVIRTGGRLYLGNNLAMQNSALNTGSVGGPIAGLLGLSTGAATGAITGSTASPSPTFGGLLGSRHLAAVIATTSPGNNAALLTATQITGFTLNPGDGQSFEYEGNIVDFAPGTTLTKTGAGSQTLSGTYSYTGATTVEEGTLLINGNHTGGGLITVEPSATLGGIGTVGSVIVEDFGILAPGTSAGTFTVDSLTLSSFSRLEFELGLPNQGAFASDSDFVQVQSTLTLDGELYVSALPGFEIAAPGDSWVLFAYQPGLLNNMGLTIASTPPGATFIIDTNTSAGEVLLTMTAIPEPTTFLLFCMGVTLLGFRRHIRTCAR